MSVFIGVLIILVCVFLVLVILVQNPKGGGLSSEFGSANQIGGVRKTADFLEKSTWGLAIALVVLSLVAAATQDNSQRMRIMDDPAPMQQQMPSAPEE
jgi:preprotein translocase subunit SecG